MVNTYRQSIVPEKGIVTVTGRASESWVRRTLFHATATASSHRAVSALKIEASTRDEMSLMVEGVVDGGMNIEKTLRGSRRLEPLHLALSSPHDLMGVFSAIVFSEASITRAGEAQLPESRAVGAQLVGDQQLRCEALFLEGLQNGLWALGWATTNAR